MNKFQLEQIINLYNEGFGTTKISKILNVDKYKIIYNLKKNGIKLVGPKLNKKKYNEEKIIEDYINGKTLKEISLSEEISSTTILNVLRSNEIKRRKQGKKTITLNEACFSEFSDESCYWAGFLAADGNVFKNTICLHLHSKDFNHLEKFKEFTGCSSLIRKRKNQDSHYFRFGSEKIKNDLERNFNVVSCKSLILLPPKLPEKFNKHFVRGYFDGDGCISKSIGLNFEIYSGSQIFLEWIKDKIIYSADLKSNSRVRHKEGNCYRIGFYGKQVKKIMNWLYEDCKTSYLSRKKEKYVHFLEDL